MLIFAGVDGTGVRNNALYSVQFSNSIVQRLYRSWTGVGPRHYQRGPGDSGYETSDLSRAASYWVELRHREAQSKGNARISVFLAGYSRGAAAVIESCHHLRDAGIGVDCLLLCDAVERTVGYTATTVPENVVRCFHAVRDPMSMSRRWMGNCGRTVDAPQATRYVERLFHCTHGAMGGTPWLTPDGDVATGTGNRSIQEDGGFADSRALGVWADAAATVLPVGRVVVGAYRSAMGTKGDPFENSGRTHITPTLDRLVSEQVWSWINGAARATLTELSAGLGRPGGGPAAKIHQHGI